jgi:hypothetical protein
VAAARAAEAALLHAARVGTVEDVRACASRVAGSSLADIDAPGSHGVTPLHAAATRGDVDVARALLDAGAAACHSHARPLRADAESGWTATHRAMYHGKWRVVQALLERGGSLDHPPDLAGRTPLDVLASRLRRSRERRATLKRDALREKQNTRRETHTNDNDRTRSVYSWGSGVNYALGHGGRDDVATPRRVDFTDVVLENADEEKNDTTGGFRDDAISVSCSKFHSVVAFRDGSVFAWGHGRGGRLGVMDAGVHDGDVAALRPTEVFFPRASWDVLLFQRFFQKRVLVPPESDALRDARRRGEAPHAGDDSWRRSVLLGARRGRQARVRRPGLRRAGRRRRRVPTNPAFSPRSASRRVRG